MRRTSSWVAWLGVSSLALVSLVGCSDTNNNGQADAVNGAAVNQVADKAGDVANNTAAAVGDAAKDTANAVAPAASNVASAAVNTPKIQAAFTANASLKNTTINVDSTSDTIKLSGTVTNATQKSLARALAQKNAPGMKIDDSKLTIKGGKPATMKKS